jgi:hypothetical protein
VDFFARQEQSRRTSRALVAVFVLAFIVVALATTVVVTAALRPIPRTTRCSSAPRA